ncbi:membrane integrity-associated transporter subunit PqiC [Kangiella sp. TOML190]|uniref:PqiC family protein n=1 Tax=Kangiella sp. TOML190 TaxID=2931351 RepID=UPI002041A835|nr:ABC-type transport auxiliary lipoprotein family protein [Kangiella sp. TOML190]
MKYIMTFCSLLILLSACSSSPPAMNYYLLDSTPVAIDPSPGQTLIKLSDVSVPNYLDQTNLVMRDANHKLIVANYHSWADDMSNTIRRVLMADLNQASNNYSFVSSCETCTNLEVSVEHFYPTQQGDVILSGTYQLKDDSSLRRNFLIKNSLPASGYEQSVATMRESLKQLAQEINQDLSQ